MAITDPCIEIRDNSADVYEQFRNARRQTLIGAEDDMWATFADMAKPHALALGDHVIGSCSIDNDHQLHAFHINPDFETTAPDVLAHVIDTKEITAAIASTVDPAFLSLSLAVATGSEPVALMYEHVADPARTESVDIRPATPNDHGRAVMFYAAETGSPKAFLDDFLAERIEKNELYLTEDHDRQIAATGECRADTRTAGHAHLGLVVRTELRGRGTGRRLMQGLVELAKGQSLTPLCSTEPTNLAAQRLIHRTGFRTRHRVLRLAINPTTP